jgi:hypothetical protein
MNQQEQDECFNALVFSLTSLIKQFDVDTLDGRRVIGTIENAAEGLVELKTADNLHRSIIALQEKVIARYHDERKRVKADADAFAELQRVADALAADNVALFDSNLALQDMLDSAHDDMEMLRDRLGVPVEPHQTLFERMLEKAGDIQGVFLRGYAAALCTR